MSLFNDEPCAFGTCVACDILQQADETLPQWYARLREMAGPPAEIDPDFCRNGHPKTEENTYTDRDGWKSCRPCRRAARSRHAKQGAA